MSAAEDRTAAGGWTHVRNILAIRLDSMGDVLMTGPALAAIRDTSPHARITVLTSHAGALAVPHLGIADETLIYSAPWVAGNVHEEMGEDLGRSEAALIASLAALRFDAAIVFTVCTQSPLPAAFMARIAGIPRRLAYCRENPYGLLTEWAAETDEIGDGMRHEVQRHLDLVSQVGFRTDDDRLRFQGEARHFEEARLLLQAGNHGGSPYFVVHPGASAPSRRYPAEFFGDAAEEIARRSGRLAVFTGSPDEQPLVDRARARMSSPSISLAGRLSVAVLGAVIAEADLLVSNNTGPAHIAAAVDTPVVDLYALTNPQHTPWRVRSVVLSHNVPCRYCLKSVCPEGHNDCLRAIPPSSIVHAALSLLDMAPVETTEGRDTPVPPTQASA